MQDQDIVISKEMIDRLSAKQMLDERFVSALLAIGYDGDPVESVMREQLYGLAQIRAKELNIKQAFCSMYAAAKKAQDAVRKAEKEAVKRKAELDKQLEQAVNEVNIPEWQKRAIRKRGGVWETAIENFLLVMQNDDYFDGIQFNLLSNCPEKRENDGTVRRWTDADDADARKYIEGFGMYSPQKYDDALRIRFTETAYHPIRDYIETLKWDGIDRIEQFFQFAVKSDDTPYIREAARLIFAGGIQRLYNPGCKYDEMIVLVGTHQGEGKSTLVRWLAMQDQWFGEVSEIEGQRGIEGLEGKWILEIAELLAMVRAKEAEAQKAFITRQEDRYRHPFDKRVSAHPRQCIFIGTTNKAQFLTDKTGNRRYIPVKITQPGTQLYDREAEVKAYILQCWAEAYAKRQTKFMKPVIKLELLEDVRIEQEIATEDDYREGMISDYLDENGITEVPIIELWEKALHKDAAFCPKPSRRDSNDIALILTKLGFERGKKSKRFANYGVQAYFFRSAAPESSEADGGAPPF